MRRLLAFLPAAVLVLAGCGETCSTAPAELAAIASSCTLRSGANVQLEVKPDCQRCGESSPSCGSELVGGAVELTPIYQTCQGDTGCPTTECGTNFICNVALPPASGFVMISYPTANGGVNQVQVPVSAGGVTSCSL